MKLFCPCGWRWAAFALALGLGPVAGRAATPKPVPAARGSGEKIEFTQPREVVPLKPMTGTDLQGRSFNTGSRDTTPADAAGLVSSMPLPAPSDVNRLRALQELLGRRGQADGGGAGSSAATSAMSLDTGLDNPVEGSGTRLTIDDLFDRQRGRRVGEEREFGDNRKPGSNRDDRYGGSDRNRPDDLGDRDRDASGRSDSKPDLGETGSKSSRNLGNNPDSTRDQRFLPDIRSREDEFRDSLLGRKREGEEGLSLAGDRMTSRMGLSLHDNDDPAAAREERMEAFRRMLGGGTAVDSWLSSGARAGAAGAQAGPGGLGVPGTSTSGARTLGAALDGRGTPGSSPSGAVAEATADRTFAIPTRPLELNLGTGRGAIGNSDPNAAGLAPMVRPMELFQRKHDSRLPSRGF